MCRYMVECVGVFFIAGVAGSLWNVSVYCGICRYVFIVRVKAACGMCLYIVECVGMFYVGNANGGGCVCGMLQQIVGNSTQEDVRTAT